MFANILKQVKNCFANNKTKEEKEVISYFNTLKWEITSFKAFIFSVEKLQEIISCNNKIKKIYKNLFEYIVSWEFIKENELELIKEIEVVKENFLNENIESIDKEFEEFKKNIDILIKDINEISNFKLKNKYKRDRLVEIKEESFSDIVILFSNITTLNERYIFKMILSLNIISFYFEYFHNSLRNIYQILISFYEILNQKDDWQENNKQVIILKSIVELLLFKISLIYKRNKISYLDWQNLKYINIEKSINQWIFKNYKEMLSFVCNSTKSYIIDDIYQKFRNKNKITNLEKLILTKYYKNVWKDYCVLKDIFNKQYNPNKNELNENINTIYIGNNLLSLLISHFQKTSIENNQEYIEEIDILYKKITNLYEKINQNYNNHFSYLKYTQFKNLQYNLWNKLHKKGVLISCEKALEKAKKELNKLNYNCFYEFNFEDSLLQINVQDETMKKIYLHNIFYFPFDIKAQQNKITLEQNSLFQNKVDFNFYEKFSNVEEKIDSHKLDTIAIIGIFTGIVVYSLWTIQIFTIIEDLWSAIMFAWVFLSWILFLLWWIYYKQWLYFNIKQNKWLNLFLIATTLLVLTFIWKYFFSWINLNANKANNIKDSLETSIQKADYINKILEEKIKIHNNSSSKVIQ